MADIASRLASDFLAAQGWACILLTPHDAARSCVVTVDGITARDEPGVRLWFAQKHTDKLMAALLNRCRESRRRPRGSGLIVSLPVTAVAGIIRDIAANYGYAVAADEFIDEQLALVTRRIGDALARSATAA